MTLLVAIIGILLIVLFVTLIAYLWDKELKKEDTKDSFVKDYRKWAKNEVKRIIDSDTQNKPLF